MEYNPEYNDVSQSVDYLSRAFARARKDYMDVTNERPWRDKSGKKSTIMKYEEDFCYLINEIQKGSVYLVAKNVAAANELINEVQSSASSS